MFQAYESTLPYRIALGVAFFLTLGALDWIRNPSNPTRVKEYLFLVFAMFVSMAYGLVHDHLTATISPEYFLQGKRLAEDPRPFRLAVSLLAIKATYGPGLLAGALLLIANNPSHRKPQLRYGELVWFCSYPVVGALSCAFLGAMVLPAVADQTWLKDAALAFAAGDRAGRFLVTWGIHAGSYMGVTLGTVVAVAAVVRKRKLAAYDMTAESDKHLETT